MWVRRDPLQIQRRNFPWSQNEGERVHRGAIEPVGSEINTRKTRRSLGLTSATENRLPDAARTPCCGFNWHFDSFVRVVGVVAY